MPAGRIIRRSMRDDLFKEKVGRYSSKEIGRQARELRNGSMAYSIVMLDAYNWKMKQGLPRDLLYGKPKKKTKEPIGTGVSYETDLYSMEV